MALKAAIKTDLKSATSHRRVPLIEDAYNFLLKYREQYMKENKIKSLENLKGKKVFLTSNGNTIIAHFLWTKKGIIKFSLHDNKILKKSIDKGVPKIV